MIALLLLNKKYYPLWTIIQERLLADDEIRLNICYHILVGGTSMKPLTKVNMTKQEYPEKVLQFGEGNFLRAFVDWQIEQLNQNTDFKRT